MSFQEFNLWPTVRIIVNSDRLAQNCEKKRQTLQVLSLMKAVQVCDGQSYGDSVVKAAHC